MTHSFPTRRTSDLAPVGIKADMVIKRAITPGSGRSREIEGTQLAATQRRANDFHHIGVGLFGFMTNLDSQSPYIRRPVLQRQQGTLYNFGDRKSTRLNSSH